MNTILLVLLLAAEDPPKTATVVVEERRFKSAAEQYPAAPEDALSGRGSAASVLERIPGIQVFDRDNPAQDLKISVRGFGARGNFGIRSTRLLIDGIPADSPDGQGQLGALDLSLLEAVAFESGPFSARSAGSAGGLISFRSRAPRGEGFRSTIALGSFAQTRLSLDGSSRIGDVPVGFSHSRFSRSGERTGSSAERVSSALSANAALGSLYRFDLHAQRFQLDNALDPQGLSLAELRANPRGVNPAVLLFSPRKDVRQGQVGIALNPTGSAPQISAWWGERHVTQFLTIPEAVQRGPLHPGGVIDFERVSRGLTLEQTLGRGIVGFSIDHLDEDRLGFQNFLGNTRGVLGALKRSERNRVARGAVFAEWRYLAAPFELAAGARVERVSYRSDDRFVVPGNPDDSFAFAFSQFNPFARLRYVYSPHVRVHAHVGRGFEAPTLGELAYAADGDGFNRSLTPATSQHAELGLRLDPHARIRINATLFGSRTRDEIVPVRNQGGRSAFQNASRVGRQGVELKLRARPADRLRLNMALMGLSARYRDDVVLCTRAPCFSATERISAGSRLPGLSERVAYLEAVWRLEKRWQARLNLKSASGFLASDRAQAEAPGYWVAGLGLSKRWRLQSGSIDLDARIDNLTDRSYINSVIINDANERYFEPAPGRTLSVAVSVSF